MIIYFQFPSLLNNSFVKKKIESLLQEKFASLISEAGFQMVEYENLVGGVVAIHSGLKI